MNRKLFFSFVAMISFAISCQNASVAQIEKAQPKNLIQTVQQPFEAKEITQQDKTTKIGGCEDRVIHGDFIFTGQVKEIMPYRERLLSQSKSSYYHPKNEFKSQKTIRFAVDKIYDKSRNQNDEVKEILAYVVGSATEPALSFEVGESYLVYATPRYCGKNDYDLEDNLIIYPDPFTLPISQSQERIFSLENPPPTQTPNEMFGIDSKELILTGGIIGGKASRLVQPKYPEEAKTKKAGGKVTIALLINEEGRVSKFKTLCADDETLIKAAEDAAFASRWTPVVLSGKPRKVTGNIVYNFVAQ